MTYQYGFGQNLEMSQGVSASKDVGKILLSSIPAALRVHPAHIENDKSGVDWWVECLGGKFLAVDGKVRREDWSAKEGRYKADDLALETWSVVENKIVGWTRDKRKLCDYILWLWTDTGRWCLIPFPMLCHVFSANWETWASKYKTATQNTENRYHSECVFVPRRVVWAEIYSKFSGVPNERHTTTGRLDTAT